MKQNSESLPVLRFEVFSVASGKNTVLWDVMPRGLVEMYIILGEYMAFFSEE
jgi:hypothetical protein